MEFLNTFNTDIDSHPSGSSAFTMDGGDISIPDSPILESGIISPDDTEQSILEKQRATLQTYLDSVPYECESIEEMQDKLEHIVSKIYICAKTCDWLALTSWDGLLQWWVATGVCICFVANICSCPSSVGFLCGTLSPSRPAPS